MTFSPQELPNRFEFAEAQDRLYEMWEQGNCFDADASSSKEPYCIVIPPPNVTGALHLGHALNNTLQDIQIRMKRMQGFEALWMPGTDHAGIATQAVVERRLKEDENKTRHDIGRDALIARIWEWKEQYGARIIGQLKQMGFSCDWKRTRFTLDETCARAVRHTFFDLFGKGLIYRGKKLVNWDTDLRPPSATMRSFRRRSKDIFGTSTIPSSIRNRANRRMSRSRQRDRRRCWATRPLPFIQIRPKLLIKLPESFPKNLPPASAKDEPAIQQQIDDLNARRAAMLKGLETLRDMANDGRMLMLPLMDREIPLVCDEWAKPEMGSGCVKITPAHDPNDYEVGKRCSLPMINIINPQRYAQQRNGRVRRPVDETGTQ